MALDAVVSRFTEQAPVATMVRATMANVLSPRELDRIFREHRERQYQDTLLFSSVVGILALAVHKVQPSLHAAYQSQRNELDVSVTALYDKIAGVELPVIRELVRRTAERMAAVIEAFDQQRPPVLEPYRTFYLDGSHLAATEHRLKETRRLKGGPLPGQGLVVLDGDRRVISDFLPCTDGHAQERSLLLDWIDLVAKDQLWIADRNFCTKLVIFECQLRAARFLLRHHEGLSWEPAGPVRKLGRCATGAVEEQPVSVDGGEDGVAPLRRLTIHLDEATAAGAQEIHLLTNLPADVSAAACADLYHTRWTIEAAFGEITLALRGEIDTLCYPPAALLAYAIALVTYNLLAVTRAAMSVVHGHNKVDEQVSTYYLANEVTTTWHGLEIAVSPRHWQSRYGSLEPAKLAAALTAMARHTELRRYQKHPRGAKKSSPARRGSAPHVSTARLLAKRR